MTVRNLLLTAAGDLAPLVNGNLQLVSDVSAIAQAVQCNLRTFLGEWFLDDPASPKIGTPYFQKILVKNPEPRVLRSAFKAVIEGTVGVAQVTQLDLKYTAPRSLSVAWRGISDTGQFISGSPVLTTP